MKLRIYAHYKAANCILYAATPIVYTNYSLCERVNFSITK